MTEDKVSILDLVYNLSRISDVRQRSYALAFRLKELDNNAIIDLIKTIREKASLGEADYYRLYNALSSPFVFSEVLGTERISQLISTAEEKQEYEIIPLLTDLPIRDPSKYCAQPYLDNTLKELPLGIRKALARKPDFKLVKQIAKDQDHRVIEPLLDNPRLTEMDVIRIGSTRPTSPKVLEAIYRHQKWISRYSIKRVLVLNPYCPLPLSLRLVNLLNLEDLNEIIHSPDLNQLLIQEAQRIIKMKNAHNASANFSEYE